MQAGGIVALLSPLLAIALLAPTTGTAQTETLASTCVVAEMIAMQGAGKFDPDRYERIEVWQALNFHEKDGMVRAALLAVDMRADPALAKAEAERCAAIDPTTRLPALPKAPSSGRECLEPMTRATELLGDSLSGGKPDPKVLCTALPEVQGILADGRKALEEGKVACTDPRTTWVSLSNTAWLYGMMSLATSDSVDCSAPGDGQSHS